jgi:hypothetical protein
MSSYKNQKTIEDYENDTTVLFRAAAEFLRRHRGWSAPTGEIEQDGCWRPSGEERQECCDSCINESCQAHCREAEHVAHLFGINSSDELEILVNVLLAWFDLPSLDDRQVEDVDAGTVAGACGLDVEAVEEFLRRMTVEGLLCYQPPDAED